MNNTMTGILVLIGVVLFLSAFLNKDFRKKQREAHEMRKGQRPGLSVAGAKAIIFLVTAVILWLLL